MSALGKAVDAWMKERGYCKRVVAGILEVAPRTLGDWMTVERLPTAVPMLAKLAALMGSTVEDLLDIEPDLAPFRDPVEVEKMLRRCTTSRQMRMIKKRLEQHGDRRQGECCTGEDSRPRDPRSTPRHRSPGHRRRRYRDRRQRSAPPPSSVVTVLDREPPRS